MNDIIKKLYNVFPQLEFTIIDYCKCGCCKHINIEKLTSSDRESIDYHTLGKYADKALTTIGEIEHYKHFLPRICEMLILDESRCGMDMCLLSKLEYANFQDWNPNEKDIISQFFKLYLKTEVSSIEDDSDNIQLFIKKYNI